MSSTTVTIGTQTVPLTVKIAGNTQDITFTVTITSYNGQPVNQQITVTITCPATKLQGNPPTPTTVQVTPQECVSDWLQQMKNVYTFA